MLYQHKLRILSYATKSLWLLAFPIIRGLLTVSVYDIDQLYRWLSGFWFDIMIIALIIFIGYLKWRNCKFTLGESLLTLYDGIIMKEKYQLSYNAVSSLIASRKVSYRIFGAVKVFIDTNSGTIKQSDIILFMKKSDYEVLEKKLSQFLAGCENIKENATDNDRVKCTYKPRWFGMIFFSFVFSSTLSGAFFLATLFSEAGKITGTELQERFTSTINGVATKIAFGIPPVALVIGIVILSSWLLSCLINVIRYVGFRILRKKNSLVISMGLFSKKNCILCVDKINYVDLRQNLISKFFSMTSVNVKCTGYGKDKAEIPVLIPMVSQGHAVSILHMLIPKFIVNRVDRKPSIKVIYRYISPPLTFMIVVPAIGYISHLFLPQWNSLIVFLSVMLEIPFVYLFFVKLIAFFTSGYFVNDNNITIKYSNLYAYHTIVTKRDRLTKIVVEQNIFHKKSDTCDVIFYFNQEKQSKHRVKGVSYSMAKKDFFHKI